MHSRSTNTRYENLPRAAVSPDGRYILFDSDMQSATAHVYIVIMPAAVSASAPTL